MTQISPPTRISADSVPRRQETADGGFEVAIPVDARSHGSDVLLGLQWVQPGTERVSWRAGADTHEVYYLVSGVLRLEWAGDDAGRIDLVAGDSFFFPPAREYSVENRGTEAAFVVWAMTPAEG